MQLKSTVQFSMWIKNVQNVRQLCKWLIDRGIVALAELYKKHFTTSNKSDKAIRRIIQLPVVIFQAFRQLFVTEYVKDVDFVRLSMCISKFVPQKPTFMHEQ